jgi:hypothetical protein
MKYKASIAPNAPAREMIIPARVELAIRERFKSWIGYAKRRIAQG